MYCSKCGKENSDGAKYCQNCGMSLDFNLNDNLSKSQSEIQNDKKLEIENPVLKGDEENEVNGYGSIFKKYFTFKGRVSRTGFWLFYFVNNVIFAVLAIIDIMFGIDVDKGEFGITYIYMLVLCIPMITVGVKRMHDVGKSGWYFLIPIYNLLLAIMASDKEDNEYGPGPIDVA